MSNGMKKAMMLLLILVILASQVWAVGKAEESSGQEDMDEVIWYRFLGPMAEYPFATGVEEKISEAVNEYLASTYGFTVDIRYVGSPAEYNKKIPLLLAAGEKMDVVFGAVWSNNHKRMMTDGYLAPLDDLIKEYAPNIKRDLYDPGLLKNLSYEGSVRAVYPDVPDTSSTRIIVPQYLVDKYNWDLSKIKSWQDIEQFFPDIINNEPEKYVLNLRGGLPVTTAMFGSIDLTWKAFSPADFLITQAYDPKQKVYEISEAPGYQDAVLTLNEWYQKGYLPPDSLTIKADHWRSKNASGDIAFTMHPHYGNINIFYNGSAAYGETINFHPDGDTITNRGYIQGRGIHVNSEVKESAMKLLDALHGDDTLVDLLYLGIEGEHYNKVGGKAALVDNSGYFPHFGSSHYAGALLDDVPEGFKEKVEANLEKAKIPLILGFNLDAGPIKTELANCSAVWSQYKTAILLGTIDDYPSVLADYRAAMKDAGIDAVKVEVQRQVDAYISQ
jgi:putative aldouronate transport system substrate-binding protein